ncbi:hypothetical protein HNR42_002614 [Deinobacterium chartae]|uniref:Uncharacterized protein n=1 Tax=Deinobacterium chartae TaxID=521158 RepID=A0A841I455_9DEIO|nr:DUF5693 family protein [Deinobacterium chartae]MBB6099178.1 hypothetical protein [Deinobacterium chartae]
MLRRILMVLILLSLIPALLLVGQRIQFENAYKTVALLMDFPSLQSQASVHGLTASQLLERYRQYGVNGVAVYEDTLQSKVRRGELIYRDGAALLTDDPQAPVKPNWTYLSSVQPGLIESLRDRYNVPYEEVQAAGRHWTGWPVDARNFLAGPDQATIDGLKASGYLVAYRPYDQLTVKEPGSDLPDVPFLIFNGLTVPGSSSPERLAAFKAQLGERQVALIEGTLQKGIVELVKDRPALRLFSISPAWQETLRPEDVASKFVLAARERSHRLLYFRPYDTLEATEAMLQKTQAGLQRAGFRVGTPGPLEFAPSSTLRWLAMVGPLAALLLVALSYPLRWLGFLTALGTLGLVVVAGGLSFDGGALLAAVVFPALGFILRRSGPLDWLIAIGVSLIGIFLLSAIGADRMGMLGLAPFAGVSLTLLLPLVLFGLSLVPNQDIRITLSQLYNIRLRLGDLALMALGLVLVALVVLRRGNTPGIGVSGAEEQLRGLLQDNLIRPRFKELVGHPVALLGLAHIFPAYMSVLLLLVGVIGQSSLVNTFEHYHTPLTISLLRAFNGVWIGGLIGLILIPVIRLAVRWFNAAPKAPESAVEAR